MGKSYQRKEIGMRLKLFALIASTIAALSIATTAQAQSLTTIIDLVASGSQAATRMTYNPCRYSTGLDLLNCRIQAAKHRVDTANSYSARIERERRQAENRRAALQGGPNRLPNHLLYHCSWGIFEACADLNISQTQASQILENESTTPVSRENPASSSTAPAASRQLSDSEYAAARARLGCRIPQVTSCTLAN